MWSNDDDENDQSDDEQAISDKYARGDGRIIIETNREKLPGFIKSLSKQDYMDLRPFYQRRPRWERKKQSLLIESFIMNIPVPPVFLYENDFNSYEVMDGQQRISALRDFYDNRFALTGLTVWPELNGRKYHNLPQSIKSGLDRRSISSIVVLKESTGSDEDADFLREIVFERLNTGGTDLSPQEIRNALYSSPFNDMLLELSRWDLFREVWGLPEYVENEIELTPNITKIPLFAKMEDMELILRFFALRHVTHYKKGMRGFLDIYMRRAANFADSDISILEEQFVEVFALAYYIYDGKPFRPFDPDEGGWQQKPYKAFYDAVMVGMARLFDFSDQLRGQADSIKDKTRDLFCTYDPGTFTGRGNTKADVENRISLYENMLRSVIA